MKQPTVGKCICGQHDMFYRSGGNVSKQLRGGSRWFWHALIAKKKKVSADQITESFPATVSSYAIVSSNATWKLHRGVVRCSSHRWTRKRRLCPQIQRVKYTLRLHVCRVPLHCVWLCLRLNNPPVFTLLAVADVLEVLVLMYSAALCLSAHWSWRVAAISDTGAC